MSDLSLPKSIMLKSAAAWEQTFLEPTAGWPGLYTIIWRAADFHGKISGSIKSKTMPTKRRVAKELERELLRRLSSNLRCDAKRVAFSWLAKNKIELPPAGYEYAQILQDALYSLDNRIAGEFFSSEPPKLFTGSSHGWILGEVSEIRCIVAHLCRRLESAGVS